MLSTFSFFSRHKQDIGPSTSVTRSHTDIWEPADFYFILFLFGIIRNSKTPVHKVTKFIFQKLAVGFAKASLSLQLCKVFASPWDQ